MYHNSNHSICTDIRSFDFVFYVFRFLFVQLLISLIRSTCYMVQSLNTVHQNHVLLCLPGLSKKKERKRERERGVICTSNVNSQNVYVSKYQPCVCLFFYELR